MYGYQWITSNLRCYSLFYFIFETWSLTGLGFARSLKLAGQWALGFYLSLLPLDAGLTNTYHHSYVLFILTSNFGLPAC